MRVLETRAGLPGVKQADGRCELIGLGFKEVGGGALRRFDAETLEEIGRPATRIHEGSPKSYAMSDDGSLLATGASDGIVRVWDAGTFALLHEISLGETEAQGVAFLDHEHLAVATRRDGTVLLLTLDADELLHVARAALTRTFTQFECDRYRIAPCPTLRELRAG